MSDNNIVTTATCTAIAKESFKIEKAEGHKDSAYTKGKSYACVLRGSKMMTGARTAIIKDDDYSACEIDIEEARKLFEIKED